MIKKALFVVAHPDDELLGCGGTLAYLKSKKVETLVLYLSEGVSARFNTLNSKNVRTEIINRENMAKKVSKFLNFKIIGFLRHKNLRMDCEPLLDITKKILKLIEKYKPDYVFTHHPNDLNLDHRITYQATINACRPSDKLQIKKILLFETPSSSDWSYKTGIPFRPNHFYNIEKFIKKKIKALNYYKKEMRKFPHPRSKKNIEALAIVRGGEIGFKFAEAFEIERSLDI